MRSAVQSCVPLQESTANRCVFFVYIPNRPRPEGAGHWRFWRRKLAFKGSEMTMDRQGAKRLVDWWLLTTKISQRAAPSFLGYHATGHNGLEGALRATETSCVPLLENQALTKFSWVLFCLWGTLGELENPEFCLWFHEFSEVFRNLYNDNKRNRFINFLLRLKYSKLPIKVLYNRGGATSNCFMHVYQLIAPVH